MMALTHLFIYILRFPHRQSVRSDLSLLDMAAGHWSRIEFISDSELSFSFARELAALARKAVDKACADGTVLGTQQADTIQVENSNDFLLVSSSFCCPIDDFSQNDLQDASFSPSAFELEDWSILSSMLMDDRSII